MVNSYFAGESDFNNSEFHRELSFGGSVFMRHLTISSKIYLLALYGTAFNKDSKKFKLDLELAQIEKTAFSKRRANAEIDENDDFNPWFEILRRKIKKEIEGDLLNIHIDSSKSRETFLILKQCFLRMADNITALEFHKKEYEKYQDSLKKSRNFQDKFLLCIEKNVSYFGTSVKRSFNYLILINFAFLFIYILIYEKPIIYFHIDNIYRNLNLFAKLMNPVKSEEFIFFNLIQLSVNSFLLYEFIKSLRKFSRKL